MSASPISAGVRHVLLIDDEFQPADAFLRLLTAEGFRVDLAGSGAEGLARATGRRFDAIVIDLHLPDMFGITVLQRLRTFAVTVPVLAVTGHYLEPEVEVTAFRAGATAFSYKPFLPEDVAAILRSIIEDIASDSGTEATSRAASWRYGIVAASPAMKRVVSWIDRVGPSRVCALVTGETGTGKELVARGLHEASARSRERFVPINCAAITESLVETALFGHCRGAFTGATGDREGMFETAHRGTLFLDEIGELPLSLQGQLLRFLENGEVRRVGETTIRHVDVRVIAATNRSLAEEVRNGRFREDLYHRLAVARQHIPPLRERLQDLDALVDYWLPDVSRQWNQHVVSLTMGARSLLHAHPWSGNAREVRNVLERSVSISAGATLTERDVAEALSDSLEREPTRSPDVGVSDDARRLIATLDAHHWNRTKAAHALGINRTTLWRWLERNGLGQRNKG